MIMLLFAAELAALAAAQAAPSTAAPTLTAPQTADSPRVAEAKANRTRLKVAPEIISKKPKWFDAELARERALGHHGRVVVEGVIGIDGRYSDLRVRTSSRASSFDELALRVIGETVFKPARDAQGAPITSFAVFPFETLPASFAQGNLFTYRCDAAVRDYDWWRGAWPERTEKQYDLYNLITGFELIALRNVPAPAIDSSRNMAVRWEAALVTCRSTPTMNFLTALRSPLAR